jgi:glutamyl-tRNA reductase
VENARDALVDALADAHDVDRASLVDHLYVHSGDDVARHLCRVAAGLDSLVLGEAEVLGQVREAFERGTDAGPALELLFRTAIGAGRRARSETSIGANPATASSMALSLAEGVLGSLRDRNALVVGAGRVGLQTLKALAGRRIANVAVANRTLETAAAAASRFGGAAHALEELESALAWADLAVTATSSETPVVTAGIVRAALARRPERPLVLVDLAVPSDVEREAADVEGVRLFDVDDLRAGLDGTLAARLREVPKVEAIVEDEVASFGRRLRELEVEPLLAELRLRADAIREQEVERTLRRLGDVDPETAEQVELLARALVKKLLHEPTVRLRDRAGEGAADDVAVALRELFGLSAPREL